MISTLQIKQHQLMSGFLKLGSGEEKMLIMGSCRVCPLVEYFNEWNLQNGNRFTIYTLDAFNWNWNAQDQRVDYMGALSVIEKDERVLEMLKSVDVFVHEFYKNAGMFCCDKNSDKNIYQYGLNPKQDICVPSWNDIFVLFSDILAFDTDLRKKAIQDFCVLDKLSGQTESEIVELGIKNLEKFYNVCLLSDFPEMVLYVTNQIRLKRFWWTYNHTSKNFSAFIFIGILIRLGINVDDYLNYIPEEDMFANNFTPLTEYDVKNFGFDWGEEIVPLKSKIM